MLNKNKKTKITTLLLYLFFISLVNLHANNCISKSFKNNGFFKDKKYVNVFNYKTKKYKKKISDDTNLFPDCYVNNNNLFFQYLYRNDMKDILLIQYIFKSNSSNYEFQYFIEKYILKNRTFNSSVRNISSNKKIIIEFKNATTGYERNYYIKNKKIIFKNEYTNGK